MLSQRKKMADKGGLATLNDSQVKALTTSIQASVLILRPAIFNLEITAPDTMAPDMSLTFVASALLLAWTDRVSSVTAVAARAKEH